MVSDLVIPQGVKPELDANELVASVVETRAGAAEDETTATETAEAEPAADAE